MKDFFELKFLADQTLCFIQTMPLHEIPCYQPQNNSFHIKKRAYHFEEVKKIGSAEIVYYERLNQFVDKSNIDKIIDRIEVPMPDIKELLRSDMLQEEIIYQVLFKDCKVLMVIWPTGEKRYFLITNEGYLIEHENNSVWDYSFSNHMKKNNDGSMEIKVPQFEIPLKSSDLVWSPMTSNYTHFLQEVLAPLLICEKSFTGEGKAICFDPILPWQKEFLDLQSIPLEYIEGQFPSNYISLHFKELSLGISSNYGVSNTLIKNKIRKKFSNYYANTANMGKSYTIFCDRKGQSAARVSNRQEIISLVQGMNNGIVIYPDELSISEKVNLFSNARVSVVEGSSQMNSVIFGADNSSVIVLSDPNAIQEKHLWLALMRCHPENFTSPDFYQIWGKRQKEFSGDGSPLSVSNYSVEELKKLLFNLHQPQIMTF